jgi:hypothetical protein
MPEPAPERAAPDPEDASKDAKPEDSDGSEGDSEADRLAQLAARFDPVPPEVTESARRAWRTRFTRRRDR